MASIIEQLGSALDQLGYWSSGPGRNVIATAAGALAVFAPFALAQARRRRGLEARLAEKEFEAQRLEEMLLVAPDGYFCWYPDGRQRCSRRLAVMLDLIGGTESEYSEILQRFGLTDAAALEMAVSGLRRDGRGFTMDLTLRDNLRQVEIIGVRAADYDGRDMADILWVRDVTEGRSALAGFEEASHDMAGELERLQRLLDMLPVPVWMRDGDLALIWCNEAYAKAVDSPSTDLAIEEGAELAAGAALRQARALAARARAANQARTENFHLVLDGARRLVEITEAPLHDGGGDLLTIGYAMDQTRQEELSADLTRHLDAHSQVLENLSTAIGIFNADTRLAFFNMAFAELWSLEHEWLGGKPTYGNFLDSLRERRRLPEVADFRAFRDEELKRFTSLIDPIEDLLHLPDERTLRRVIAPHPFGGLIFIYEDVTDSLALERSYNTSLAVQRETLDHLHEGVALFGADGRLRLSNPAFAELWKLPQAALEDEPHVADILSHFADFFPAERWAELLPRLTSMASERQAQQGRLDRFNGSMIEYGSVPLPDGAVLTRWLNISDSARVERALLERNEALRAADRLKSEFIANVSMEVRTPLNNVIGFSELLQNEYFGQLNERQGEYVRAIGEAGQSLQGLISDILDLATIEAGQMSLQLDTFDIHAMLATVLGLTREQMRAKAIRLDFDCALDIGWMVADERRIKQVLFNLTSSAVARTPNGGHISLTARRDLAEDSVTFVVSDTGAGITQADLRQPESVLPPGGLSLSLVRSFVELHGGRVEIANDPEKGTRVAIHLPAGLGRQVAAS